MKECVTRVVLIGMAMAMGLAGCTIYHPHQFGASNAPLGPEGYEIIGPASGKACQTTFLGIPLEGQARIQAAIDDALDKSRGGDALIEVTVDTQHTNYLLFHEHCVLVNGLAVKRRGGIQKAR